MSDFADIINKCKKDWQCPELMESVNRVNGRKIPFPSPSLNWETYGGIPRAAVTMFYGPPGGGKAQPLYSKVLTPNGFIEMRDIHVGDEVFDGKGNLCHVTQIFPQGIRPIYEITTQANNKIRVADNHLNSVWWYNADKKEREDFVWDTSTLIEKFNTYKGKKPIRIDIPTVDFEPQSVPIDPYLLGVMLGDGSLHDNFDISNSEIDIINKCNTLLDQYHYELISYTHDNVSWTIRRKKEYYVPGKKTYLHRTLEELGLKVKSIDKFIPKVYLYNSYEVRTQLLQGLFDTDGSIFSDGTVEFSTSSPQLSEDFAFLVRSLGIRDLVRSSVGKYTTEDGNIVECNTSYSHQLKIPNGFKFYSSEKHAGRYKDRQNPPLRNIISIEYIGDEECQCIMVDSPEHTYISDDFIVTHNTTTAVGNCKEAIELFNHEFEDEVIALEEKVNSGKKEFKPQLVDLRDRGPKKVLYIDLEHSFDKKWAATIGITNSAIEIMQPPNVSAEKILQKVEELICTGEVGLIVLDSVPSLVTQAELDKKYGERTVASLSGLLTIFLRKITPLLPKYDCTLLIINHQRENMDNPYVDQIPGGTALKFYSSLIMAFKLGSPLDFLGTPLPQKAENPAGYLIEVRVKKQKTAPYDRKLGQYYLMAQQGIRVDFEFANLAINQYGLIKKSGAWFTLYDPDTNMPLEVDNSIVKLNGLAKVYDYLQTNVDYYERLCNFIVNDINKNGISSEDFESEEVSPDIIPEYIPE